MTAAAWWSQPFINDGSPLVVLPNEALHCWQGSAGEQECAANARRPFDLLEVSRPPMLVVSSADAKRVTVCWLRLRGHSGIILVVWEAGWDVKDASAGGNEAVEDWSVWLLDQPDVPWQSRPWRMEALSGVLVLAHAAAPAEGVRLTSFPARVGDAVPVAIEPGRYALDTATLEHRPHADGLYRCVLCRWTAVAPAKERRSIAAAQRRGREMAGEDHERLAGL